MAGRALSLLLIGAMSLLSPPALAQATASGSIERALAQLQHDDARLQTIGWRLTTANAPYCANARPAIGLLLMDTHQFNQPGAVRAAAGLGNDIAVEAVATGSPSAATELLPNQEILAIAGRSTTLPVIRGDAPFSRQATLQERIDDALTRTGGVTLTVRERNGELREVSLSGKPACPVSFTLDTTGQHAQADGTRVVVGQAFGATGSPAEQIDENEFAAVLAHEMAHNLLQHQSWLDRVGHSLANVRQTEQEADRLSVWLLANAGYDPETAPRLMRGWARRRDPGLARLPTHDSWEERARLMEAEITRLRATLRGTGKADWRNDFARE
ncbi:hypothetical protein MB02_09015 [Croceicoccus estronivorus]|uniref:hypothetical protein n=1 Tax=Croceicoccus estronivorus TaxID=1172626 RepID=UPI0008326E38|nr:hypothetical protein [Croceicoccus estronivorus]OCC23944.1 hypothetical protein MB02_09015 [Croceicoccus estronivorus]